MSFLALQSTLERKKKLFSDGGYKGDIVMRILECAKKVIKAEKEGQLVKQLKE